MITKTRNYGSISTTEYVGLGRIEAIKLMMSVYDVPRPIAAEGTIRAPKVDEWFVKSTDYKLISVIYHDGRYSVKELISTQKF